MVPIFIAVTSMFAQADAERNIPSNCTCDGSRKADVLFQGIPFDAQLILSDDGRSAEPRQATLFHVAKKLKGDAPADAKVWHVTDPDKCGVKFVYGRRYEVRARTIDGALETDSCLMPEAAVKKRSF
jgi:hypothetical protein